MFQTRNAEGAINQLDTLADAFVAASIDTTIWKISFDAESGERVRMIRADEGWLYEDINGNKQT